MKKVILLLIATFSLQLVSAQNTHPRPTKSRFYNNRFKGLPIKAGDVLVYSINKDSVPYDLIVTVKKFDKAISLDYSIKQLVKSGNILMPEVAVNQGFKYDTLLTDSVHSLKEESVFWLSHKNINDLFAVRETVMDLGNGKETFAIKNTGVMRIKYKGKEKMITVYQVYNKSNENKKHLSVLTDSKNPLILKMDVGWTMTLKEVR